jgi:ADP-heptose:LPS heptosyltransferase
MLQANTRVIDLNLEGHLGHLTLDWMKGNCADCFIGNDSGISHLAWAMGKKTIALFGPTNPAQYRPLGPNAMSAAHCPSLFTGWDRF